MTPKWIENDEPLQFYKDIRTARALLFPPRLPIGKTLSLHCSRSDNSFSNINEYGSKMPLLARWYRMRQSRFFSPADVELISQSRSASCER